MGGKKDVGFREPEPEYPYVRVALGWIGGAALLWGCILGFWHAYHWLKHGVAAAYPFHEWLGIFGIDYPHFRWAGVQKIAEWIALSPAGSVLFFGGMAMIWFGFSGVEAHDADRRHWLQRKSSFEMRQREEQREREREVRRQN